MLVNFIAQVPSTEVEAYACQKQKLSCPKSFLNLRCTHLLPAGRNSNKNKTKHVCSFQIVQTRYPWSQTQLKNTSLNLVQRLNTFIVLVMYIQNLIFIFFNPLLTHITEFVKKSVDLELPRQNYEKLPVSYTCYLYTQYEIIVVFY